MTEFWLSCGRHLLDRDAGAGLVVTDDFLKVYLARPELVPPDDACAAERRLYASLRADPRRPVAAAETAAIADPDARENWELIVAFRDRWQADVVADGDADGPFGAIPEYDGNPLPAPELPNVRLRPRD